VTDRRPPVDREAAVRGGAFALDVPERVPAIWGRDDEVLWASGEPLMIVSRPGVGKSTLVQQLALRRSGVHDGELLGHPVEVGAGRILYVAADRPQQARRSLRRMVREADRGALDSSVLAWPLPLPFDLGRCAQGDLATFVDGFAEIDTVVLDSLGHLAVGLTDDEVGARVNTEIARLVASGVEVVVIHHQRKGDASRKAEEPRTIEDVYGSTWLTAGMGSVVHLAGDPGDLIVTLRHLKQPATEVGPLTLIHDHGAGCTEIHDEAESDPLKIVQGSTGMTASQVAELVHRTETPTKNQTQKMRRRLDKLVGEGKLEPRKEGEGRTDPVLYLGVKR
jgi:hypothetical protein